MGMFAKKVAAAKPSADGGRGLYFLDGKYPLVQVDALKLIESTKPGRQGVEMFILVGDILQSNVPDRPAGMTGVSQSLNSLWESSADDVKRLLMACFPDVDPAEWDTENAIPWATGVEQPAHGRLMSLEVWTKINQKDPNKKFTVHKWSPVAAEVQAKAAELRAAAGLPKF